MTTETEKVFRIAVDQENGNEAFWECYHDEVGGGSYSDAMARLSLDEFLIVTAAERDQLLSHFKTFPGWNDPEAPTYAPHPLTVTEIDV